MMLAALPVLVMGQQNVLVSATGASLVMFLLNTTKQELNTWAELACNH